MKIVRPDLKVTLTETIAKKAKVVGEIVQEIGLAARRQAISEMRDVAMVKKLFDVIGPRYKERHGAKP